MRFRSEKMGSDCVCVFRLLFGVRGNSSQMLIDSPSRTKPHFAVPLRQNLRAPLQIQSQRDRGEPAVYCRRDVYTHEWSDHTRVRGASPPRFSYRYAYTLPPWRATAPHLSSLISFDVPSNSITLEFLRRVALTVNLHIYNS